MCPALQLLNSSQFFLISVICHTYYLLAGGMTTRQHQCQNDAALTWDPRVKATRFPNNCTTLTKDPRVKPMPFSDNCTAITRDPRAKPTLFSSSCTNLTWDARVKPTFLFGSCTALSRVKQASLCDIAASPVFNSILPSSVKRDRRRCSAHK